jgi:hypothetical protein
MNWHFNNENRQKLIIDACNSREGTPFREGMSKNGAGYDCAHFVRDCYKEAGVDTSLFDKCPKISLNAGKLSSTSLLVEWLHSIGKDGLVRLDDDCEIMCGDIICIRERKSCIHIALAENNEWAWHVPYASVVSRIPVSIFRNDCMNQIECVFRMKEIDDNV